MGKFINAALLAGALWSAPAHALTINLIDVGGFAGSPGAKGFAIAARYWESALANDAVVNIQVSVDRLAPNVLSSTWVTDRVVPVSDFEASLAATGTSPLDAVASRSLPHVNGAGSIRVVVPGYDDRSTHTGVADRGLRNAPADGSTISSAVRLANANYKALAGARDAGLDAQIDAEIDYSSSAAFDYDPGDGVGAGETDFVAVAVHEISHVLGFRSGVDDFDHATRGAGVHDQSFAADAIPWGYAGDLFRYSARNKLNWAFKQDAYFSIDGGATAFNGAHLATGAIHGDGWEAAHWRAPTEPNGAGACSPDIGVMVPYFCGGQEGEVTASDLAYLDAIGWNPKIDVLANPDYGFTTAEMASAFATPEPSTWLMLAAGFAACGAAAARRARSA